ncbi:MAG TPA: hypothetical protein VMW17_07385 [Candidatus Binatia bacterium]|nr:hypothetical protein [Candidatus Binatia bacterium]
MPNLTTPLALFASNYLAEGLTFGGMHTAFAVLCLGLLAAALMLVLNTQSTATRRPRLASTRPALQH